MKTRFIEIFVKDSDVVMSVNINFIVKIQPYEADNQTEGCTVYINEEGRINYVVSNYPYKEMKNLLNG